MNQRRLAVALLLAASAASCSKAPVPTPVCTFTIAPSGHAVPAAGGTRAVSVTASAPTCSWTTTPSVSWIALPFGGTGTGSGAFEYVVANNPTTDSRSGAIHVSGHTHTVTQDGQQAEPPPPPPCTVRLTPESASIESAGGSGTVEVDAPIGCSWLAVSRDAWLIVDAEASTSGRGTVRYRALAHGGSDPRTGTITVADQAFTLRQDGFDSSVCTYAVSPVEFNPCLLAGSVVTRIETTDRCPWTVSATASWLTVDGGTARTGSADIRAQFSSNYAAPREGVLQVRWPTATAGQNVRVAQAGCLYATTVSAFTIGGGGGALSFGLLQQAMPNSCGGPLQDACVWSATTTAPWITITTTMPQRGDQTVNVTVAANGTGQSRTGAIVVHDRTVTIQQAAQVP